MARTNAERQAAYRLRKKARANGEPAPPVKLDGACPIDENEATAIIVNMVRRLADSADIRGVIHGLEWLGFQGVSGGSDRARVDAFISAFATLTKSDTVSPDAQEAQEEGV